MSSSAFIFDRLAYVDRLRAAGTYAHAEALDAALRDQIASKADIDRLETKIGAAIERLKVKIETTTADLKAEILCGMLATQLAVGALLLTALRMTG